jgi:hypothetical protein
MSKSKTQKTCRLDPPIEIKKLWYPYILRLNEIMINNNLRICREMGLEANIKYEDGKFSFEVLDPSKPRRKRFYECRDDKKHRQILNRLHSLYKV